MPLVREVFFDVVLLLGLGIVGAGLLTGKIAGQQAADAAIAIVSLASAGAASGRIAARWTGKKSEDAS